MIKIKIGKIVLIVITAVMVILVGYNIFLVEYKKIEARKQAEQAARMEREVLEKIKSWEAREIAEFDQEYRKIKVEFIEEVSELSEKLNSQISSIDELKEITTQRMNASKKLKDGLSQMSIPRPLKDYYELEMKFLESDINRIALVLEYYNSGNYSAYDDERLDEAYRESNQWLLKAEEEMDKVYSEYNLEYLLDLYT